MSHLPKNHTQTEEACCQQFETNMCAHCKASAQASYVITIRLPLQFNIEPFNPRNNSIYHTSISPFQPLHVMQSFPELKHVMPWKLSQHWVTTIPLWFWSSKGRERATRQRRPGMTSFRQTVTWAALILSIVVEIVSAWLMCDLNNLVWSAIYFAISLPVLQ